MKATLLADAWMSGTVWALSFRVSMIFLISGTLKHSEAQLSSSLNNC